MPKRSTQAYDVVEAKCHRIGLQMLQCKDCIQSKMGPFNFGQVVFRFMGWFLHGLKHQPVPRSPAPHNLANAQNFSK